VVLSNRDQCVLLLVKDDAIYRSTLGHGLRSAGFHPIEAATLKEALDVLDRMPNIVIIVVRDMPPHTLNVGAFASMVKRRNKSARIVLLADRMEPDSDITSGFQTNIFETILPLRPDISAMTADIVRLLRVPPPGGCRRPTDSSRPSHSAAGQRVRRRNILTYDYTIRHCVAYMLETCAVGSATIIP